MALMNETTTPLQVSQLVHEAKHLLEEAFPSLWVEGEISNLVCHHSGHWYFSLKDDKAQIRCAMFRGFNRLLSFTPKNGINILARGKLSLYEARGDFQFVVDFMEEAGFGALQRAFELLKQRLSAEGLFDISHKKTIPPLPSCIGVITSPQGAALQDILTTLKRRFSSIPIVIYPCLVQGKEALPTILRALEKAISRKECDVLILARGGGSLEDLWPFNEEALARAMVASPLPIITGIGHEIDVTIADFVASQRAATPTAAAELSCPHASDWLFRFKELERRATHYLLRYLEQLLQSFEWLKKRLKSPQERLQERMQTLDDLYAQLQRNIQHIFLKHHHHLTHEAQRLHTHSPLMKLQEFLGKQKQFQEKLFRIMQHRLGVFKEKSIQLMSALHTLSPLKTLSRGYAILQREDGTLIRTPEEAPPGTRCVATLHEGELLCEVLSSRKKDPSLFK